MIFTWRDEKSVAKAGISGASSTLLVIASEFSQMLQYIFSRSSLLYPAKRFIEAAVLNN